MQDTLIVQDPAENAAPAGTHLEQTVEAIVRLHAEHEARATASERLIAKMTRTISRPIFLGATSLFVVGWISANLSARRLGFAAWDRSPFDMLQGIATLLALYSAILILGTQRRDDEIARHRAQLTLELALLSERKLAKLIELIEAQRRDHPALPDRIDAEAEAMAQPADPQTVLKSITPD